MIVAATFHVLPSHLARDLIGAELPPWLTRADWWALDVAATARYHDLQRVAAQRQAQTAPERPPLRSAQRGNALEHSLTSGIIGDEIPPWQR